MNYDLRIGDNRELLKTLESDSVDCIVTSPSYYNLRDYGTGTWEGGNPECSHKRDSKVSKGTPLTGQVLLEGAIGDGIYKSVCKRCGAVRKDKQIGLEESPSDYINSLVRVFSECKRVLKPTGTLWVVIGDTYGSGKTVGDVKPKDMIGIPWMLAFALRADGWYLRQDIIWHKSNPVPESVKDRCTKSHEYIFMLSKSKTYYFDNKAIEEPAKWERWGNQTEKKNHEGAASYLGDKTIEQLPIKTTKNKRDVWTCATRPYKGEHYAAYPTTLIRPCILAGCPEGGTVLDPFAGSGTTGEVALRNNRNALLLELNPKYGELIQTRLDNLQPEKVKKEVVKVKTDYVQEDLFKDVEADSPFLQKPIVEQLELAF